jgi:hypothetical protein
MASSSSIPVLPIRLKLGASASKLDQDCDNNVNNISNNINSTSPHDDKADHETDRNTKPHSNQHHGSDSDDENDDHAPHIHNVIFNWPMPRQEWIDGKFVEHDTEEGDEAWVELFIDLIYVVLLSSLANQLEIGTLGPELFFKITLSFWIICLTRQAIDEYSNRFYCHDVIQKGIYFVYTIAVFIQAIAIHYDCLHQESHLEESTTESTDDHHVLSFVIESAESSSSSNHSSVSHSAVYSTLFAVSVIITRICLLSSMYSSRGCS